MVITKKLGKVVFALVVLVVGMGVQSGVAMVKQAQALYAQAMSGDVAAVETGLDQLLLDVRQNGLSMSVLELSNLMEVVSRFSWAVRQEKDPMSSVEMSDVKAVVFKKLPAIVRAFSSILRGCNESIANMKRYLNME